MKKIKDICAFYPKSKIKAGEGMSSGKYPFYTSSSILNKYLDFYNYESEGIILGTGGNASIHYCKEKFSVSTDCLVMYSKNDEIINEYLYYYLLNNIHILENGFRGAGLKHISKKYIEDIEVNYIPNKSTQEKIIQTIKLAEVSIDKRKKQIEILDELVKSRFIEMFGDPITNLKGWKSEKLGNICTISRGGSPRPIDKFLGGPIPWIKIGDATKGDNIYLYKTKEGIIEEGVKKSRLIKKGGLIFANCGVSLGFARILKIDGCIHDGWLAFEDYEEHLDKIFFLKSLNYCTDYFRKTAPDGTQPNLNTSIMKEYVQILPPMELQQEFTKFIEQVDKLKFEMEKSLKELEDNFNSLMQKAFKGELFN